MLADVQQKLDNALPLVEQAKAALDKLSIDDFRVLKALNNPPEDVKEVFFAVQNLLCGIEEQVPTTKNGKLNVKDYAESWKISQKLMQNPKNFMETLLGYGQYVETLKVNSNNFKAIEQIVDKDTFNAESIAGKSTVAAGLCDWVVNINKYYNVVVQVDPLRKAVASA